MQVSTPGSRYDLVVIGGGMVGASFSCALANAVANEPLSMLVIEAVAPSAAAALQPSFDARSTAISFGSRRMFEAMGLWPELALIATPILSIHVSDRGRFGSTLMTHTEQQVEALGYVVENRELGRLLNRELAAASQVELLAPASVVAVQPRADGMELTLRAGESDYRVSAELVVLADGGRSPVCSQLGIERTSQDYGQHAVIANVACEYPHGNVAYERFTDSGPLALLPLPDFEEHSRAALVWTVAGTESAALMSLSDAQFLARLNDCFGDRLGRFSQVGEKHCYPLTLDLAREQVRPGLVLLGNVAHTLHPVAGQGLNLALRDSQALVRSLARARQERAPLGTMAVLQDYLSQQDSDQQKAVAFTHHLTQLFSSNRGSKVWLRKFGLLTMELIPGLKRGFATQAMGLGGK